jgi:hypothetical protein
VAAVRWLDTLRANSEYASTRLADNVLAHLVTATGSWSPHHCDHLPVADGTFEQYPDRRDVS